ncbi:Rrp15p-domain-containing protein [Lipomyces arxii]|uniref:Rrp15p-domain-containing protein n=1 Tax=Lipomyces arxii TaxID=56418 RepID=UPI0034CFDAC2
MAGSDKVKGSKRKGGVSISVSALSNELNHSKHESKHSSKKEPSKKKRKATKPVSESESESESEERAYAESFDELSDDEIEDEYDLSRLTSLPTGDNELSDEPIISVDDGDDEADIRDDKEDVKEEYNDDTADEQSEADDEAGGDDEAEDDSENDSEIENINAAGQEKHAKKKRRTDPEAFSSAMTAILTSHLKAHDRADPVLVRSKKTAKEIDDAKLEAKARRELRKDKLKMLDKERIRDVITGVRDGETPDADAVQKNTAHEKLLKKTAKRGVVKLFNTVIEAQKKAAAALAV